MQPINCRFRPSGGYDPRRIPIDRSAPRLRESISWWENPLHRRISLQHPAVRPKTVTHTRRTHPRSPGGGRGDFFPDCKKPAPGNRAIFVTMDHYVRFCSSRGQQPERSHLTASWRRQAGRSSRSLFYSILVPARGCPAHRRATRTSCLSCAYCTAGFVELGPQP